MHFRCENNRLHFLSDEDIAKGGAAMLPAGCVEISDEEADQIRAESNRPTAESVRAKRDSLLAASDWTQLPDVPEATREKWAGYRHALRDVPEQAGFPSNIDWPVAPQ